ncbi:MAG: GIY-YIG nuclease family protein, partial [Candidatus Paceibacterota bacterium]
HGPFLQHANSHQCGNGCPECKRENSILTFVLKGSKTNNINRRDSFIEECSTLHPNLDFTKTEYKNKKTKVMVTCKSHGDYEVLPRNLLRGHSCMGCFWERKSEHWTLNGWVKLCNGGKSFIYVILLENNDEVFIKCGITSVSVNKRISKISNDYNKTILYEKIDTPERCYLLEKDINKKFKNKKILPNIDFGGKFECFEYSSLNEIIGFIQNY